MRPDISVLIPARDEGSRIAPTIQAISRARTSDARVEFVVVDDASTDGSVEKLVLAVPQLLEEPGIDIRVVPLEEHAGIFRALNQAAALSSADVLFMTDAHVRFSVGWDEIVLEGVGPDRILAGTVVQEGTAFRGYGCSLLFPVMGTTWNKWPLGEHGEVPVAVCAATAMTSDLFASLGGYDEAMLVYGGGEPELSVRAWLHGAEIVSAPDLEVQHEFKPRAEHARFMQSIKLEWVHNCLRFGLLYLGELGCMQLLRYHALAYPDVFQEALTLVDAGDVFERRARLAASQSRSFEWLVDAFGMRDLNGQALL